MAKLIELFYLSRNIIWAAALFRVLFIAGGLVACFIVAMFLEHNTVWRK